MLVALPAIARGDDFLFYNDVVPGKRTRYSLTVDGVYEFPLEPPKQAVTFRHEGLLTWVNLQRVGDGEVRRAWMREMGEPKLISAEQGDPPAPASQPSERFELPPRAVQLQLQEISRDNAPTIVSRGSWLYEQAMFIALDVAHWPDQPLEPRDSWETASECEDFMGRRASRLVRIDGRPGSRVALLESVVTGEFKGVLSQQVTLTEAKTECRWRLSGGIPVSLKSSVSVKDGYHGLLTHLRLQVQLELVEEGKLSSEEREAAVQQLEALRDPGIAFKERRLDDALQELEALRTNAPNSLWMPVVEDLLARIEYEKAFFGHALEEPIIAALGRLIEAWQEADLVANETKLEPLRGSFSILANHRRDEILRAAKDENPSVRAAAFFGLAFGANPQNFDLLVNAHQDSHPRVRAWAMYGLAHWKDNDLEFDVLERGLKDSDPLVRQRACQTARACVNRETAYRHQLASLLLLLIESDDHPDVRLLAANALRRFVSVHELPRLLQLEDQEERPDVKSELRTLVLQLGGVPLSVNRRGQ